MRRTATLPGTGRFQATSGIKPASLLCTISFAALLSLPAWGATSAGVKKREKPEEPAAVVAAAVAATTSLATATAEPDGVAGLSADTRYREQACTEVAGEKATAVQEAQLQAAERDAQARAAASWKELAPKLDTCTQLPLTERTDCIELAGRWLEAEAQVTVTLDAQVETVQTDCGPRESVIPAISRTITARDKAAATAVLGQLTATDGALASGADSAAVTQTYCGAEIHPVAKQLMQQLKQPLHRCAEAATRRDTGFQGSVAVNLGIAAGGRIEAIELRPTGTDDAVFLDCLEETIQGTAVPAFCEAVALSKTYLFYASH